MRNILRYATIMESLIAGRTAGEFLKFAEDAIRKNYLVFADFYDIDPKFSRSEYEMEVMRQNCNFLDYLRRECGKSVAI